ncbi:hypothetical protein ACJDU8_01405 [Clostridium sp. WILCCON 0269]|uniref:Uncharacterized protein n=1 Tax=Candidatus Clostridium eludens TaxID=3381663 RepID=A0ABW8SFD2_9CLOT
MTATRSILNVKQFVIGEMTTLKIFQKFLFLRFIQGTAVIMKTVRQLLTRKVILEVLKV